MNEVYLDAKGKVFINGNEIKGVSSISVKTDYFGSKIAIELEGNYKCDFISKTKKHSLGELNEY